MNEREQRTVNRKTKESNNREQKIEYESKLEQIVSAVKEGFKSQCDFLSNTIKGKDQDTQANHIQQTIMHKTQQTPNTQSTTGNQAQVAIMRQMKQMPIWYPQRYPQVSQFMQPTNSFQMNHLPRFNIQPYEYTTNTTTKPNRYIIPGQEGSKHSRETKTQINLMYVEESRRGKKGKKG